MLDFWVLFDPLIFSCEEPSPDKPWVCFFLFFSFLFFFIDYCINFLRFEWNKERCLDDQIIFNYLNVVREGSRICIQQASLSSQAVILFLLYLELHNKDDLFANELL